MLYLRGLVAVWLAVLLTSGPAQAQPHQSLFGRRTILGDELREAGVDRLSDLLQHLPATRTITLDGFTYRASLGGFDPFQEPAWLLLVDGRPVDTGLFGEHNLNLLPVSIQDVLSVDVVDVPGLYRGEFAAGFIDIRTGAGLPFSASLSAQNETGDPGPYRYVAGLASPNVDGNGPDASVTAGTLSPRSALGVAAAGRLHHPTDPAIVNRLFESVHQPGSAPGAVRVIVATGGLSGHRLTPSRLYDGHASAAYVQDFTYAPFLGREIPLRQFVSRAGAAGDWSLRDQTRLFARVDYSAQRAENLNGVLGIPLVLSSDRLRVNASAKWEGRQVRRFTAGLSGDVEHLRAPSNELRHHTRSTARLYAEAASGTRAGRMLVAGATVTPGRTGAALKAYFEAGTETRLHRTSVHFAYVQSRPEERTGLSYWTAQGFTIGRAGREAPSPDAVLDAFLSADAAWRWRPRERHGMELRAFYRRHARARYLERRLTYVDPAFTAEAYAYRPVKGVTAGFTVALAPPAGLADVHLEYSAAGAPSGDELFRAAWRSVPQHAARASVTLPLPRGYSVRTDLRAQSSTHWPEYQFAEGISPDYSAAIPGHTRWDFALYRRFAQNRANLSIVFENLLNKPFRYHPIGSSFNLTLRARLAISL